MLDTAFPRIHGDIGNAETWPFPVIYKIVDGATSDKVVRKGAAGLKDDFAKAAKEVVAMGADGIGTTCGFLSLFQDDIAKAAGVPVASSSLMQVPWVDSTLPPDKRAGIITISKESVTPAHLEAVGVALDTPIVGTESGKTFTTTVLDDGDYMDFELARDDLVEAGEVWFQSTRKSARLFSNAPIWDRSPATSSCAWITCVRCRQLLDLVPSRSAAETLSALVLNAILLDEILIDSDAKARPVRDVQMTVDNGKIFHRELVKHRVCAKRILHDKLVDATTIV